MDDTSGWHEVLVDGWGPLVRDAAVTRVERATVGARGPLVGTLRAPDDARYAWVEHLHQLVLVAIFEETGADLEDLGSQAAWAAYEEVWDELIERWADGGRLAVVPLRREPEGDAAIGRLSPGAATAAGAEVSGDTSAPLWLDGRLRVDLEGLFAHLAHDDGSIDGDERAAIDTIVRLVRGR